jgi:glycosyltransferase involved in cell wall biosynthesis
MTTLEIAIPYWGDPALLLRAVQSVQGQSDPNWRLTVVDDCYPDLTVQRALQDITDPRVRYLRNETNLGISGNFQRSVDLAEHPFVTIMGADDVLLPSYVGVVRQALEFAPDVDIVQPGVQVVGAGGEVRTPLVDRVKRVLAPPREGRTILRAENLAASLLRGNWLYWPSLAFRAETLRRHPFRKDLAVIQDLAVLIEIAMEGGSLLFEPAPAFLYRRHDASASQTALLDGTRFRDERRFYAETRQLASAMGWRRARRAAALRLMSRLHAVTELPTAVARGNGSAIAACAAHIFAP